MSGAIIFWALVAIVLIYGIFVYNGLVQLKHNVSKAWSNIDVLLKQRHDELPKLVEACKQYKQFEQDTLRQVTEARARVQAASQAQDIPALGLAEGALRVGLGQIFAVAEAYPELRANEQFAQLMQRITGLEEGIADRREFYNESVNINNVRIEQFPDSFVARMFGFGPRPLLTFKADDLKDVDVKKLFA
ncbi:MAG TPA: LemA family protein [Thiobacillaceae bacterium]|nr:LemA family protein [Thiobacillaceae bacterium]HNU63189.1 LemA family protein [Thiobacillaceae bacterium]